MSGPQCLSQAVALRFTCSSCQKIVWSMTSWSQPRGLMKHYWGAREIITYGHKFVFFFSLNLHSFVSVYYSGEKTLTCDFCLFTFQTIVNKLLLCTTLSYEVPELQKKWSYYLISQGIFDPKLLSHQISYTDYC